MLELDCGQEFDAVREEDCFAALPSLPGVIRLEMHDAGAEPYLARTADIRRAAERLLRPPEAASKRLNLREVTARIRYRVTGSKFEQTLAFYERARIDFPGRYRDLLRLRPPALLKVNLRNAYPRCYVTRRMRADEGFYFGPFASRRSAEAFAEEFLDLFKTRRCQIKIRRDPSFPGCIYSEMKMCLAPCFAGCSAEEYEGEVSRLLASLETSGEALRESLEREREAASEGLDFERAAALHKRLEKVASSLRGLPDLARRVERLDAVIFTRAAESKTVAVFPVLAGIISEPVFLRFGELSSEPRSAEEILRKRLASPAPEVVATEERMAEEEPALTQGLAELRRRYGLHAMPPQLPEHLSLVARWFYSSPREGEIFFRDTDWPYRRMLRACARLLKPPEEAQGDAPQSPQPGG
jgi:excinuclease UvrABC nuclease subunit